MQSAELRFEEPDPSSGGNLSLLQAAQHAYGQIGRLLGNSPEGAELQIVALIDELAANRAASQGASERLGELLLQVRGLNQGPLPAIDQGLTDAVKTTDATDERVSG